MPLTTLTAADVLRTPTVIYNAADGSGRTYGATVVKMSTRAATPAASVTLTTSTAGGTMAATTVMTYRHTVVVDSVESLPSTGTAITTGAGTTNSVTVSIPPTAGAESYALYGRTGGTEVFMGSFVSSGTVTFVDTGATIASTQTVPSGAVSGVTLRLPSIGGSRTTAPRLIVGVAVATAPGQAGKYEYYRI